MGEKEDTLCRRWKMEKVRKDKQKEREREGERERQTDRQTKREREIRHLSTERGRLEDNGHNTVHLLHHDTPNSRSHSYWHPAADTHTHTHGHHCDIYYNKRKETTHCESASYWSTVYMYMYVHVYSYNVFSTYTHTYMYMFILYFKIGTCIYVLYMYMYQHNYYGKTSYQFVTVDIVTFNRKNPLPLFEKCYQHVFRGHSNNYFCTY